VLVGRWLERVERQHDARADPREPLEQPLVLEEPQAVGRDRDPVDALLGAQLDQPLERRVLRRLATGEVDDPALGVGRAEVAQDRLQLGLRHVIRAVVPVVRVADRAVEVARARDRHDRQLRLLLVARARAAVERAALGDLVVRVGGASSPARSR
jgi:hypothetical protein